MLLAAPVFAGGFAESGRFVFAVLRSAIASIRLAAATPKNANALAFNVRYVVEAKDVNKRPCLCTNYSPKKQFYFVVLVVGMPH
jgi:hypothetical protein